MEASQRRLPEVQSRTARGRPKTTATTASTPEKASSKANLRKPHSALPPVAKRSTIERLAKPKTPDSRYLPDKPSVYWLDYIIDPTPQQLRDPAELASYYDNFLPKFPRTKQLSEPKTIDYEDRPWTQWVSRNGVPMSALTYTASDRIKDLARPKTTALPFISIPSSKEEIVQEVVESSESPLLSSTESERRLSPTPPNSAFAPSIGRARLVDSDGNKIDFSRGDFSSISKVNYNFIRKQLQKENTPKEPVAIGKTKSAPLRKPTGKTKSKPAAKSHFAWK